MLMDEIRELDKKRTPGEWKANTDELYPCLKAGDECISMCIPHDSIGMGFDDSAFCAAAPKMAQALIAVDDVLKSEYVNGSYTSSSFTAGSNTALNKIRKAIESTGE